MLTIVVLDPDSCHIYIDTEDENDFKDKVKTLTTLYLTHPTPPHDYIMQVKSEALYATEINCEFLGFSGQSILEPLSSSHKNFLSYYAETFDH